jgi:hypothetical protein
VSNGHTSEEIKGVLWVCNGRLFKTHFGTSYLEDSFFHTHQFFFFSFAVSLRPLKRWLDSRKNQIECSRESVYGLFHMNFFYYYSFCVFGQIIRHLIEKLR